MKQWKQVTCSGQLLCRQQSHGLFATAVFLCGHAGTLAHTPTDAAKTIPASPDNYYQRSSSVENVIATGVERVTLWPLAGSRSLCANKALTSSNYRYPVVSSIFAGWATAAAATPHRRTVEGVLPGRAVNNRSGSGVIRASPYTTSAAPVRARLIYVTWCARNLCKQSVWLRDWFDNDQIKTKNSIAWIKTVENFGNTHVCRSSLITNAPNRK